MRNLDNKRNLLAFRLGQAQSLLDTLFMETPGKSVQIRDYAAADTLCHIWDQYKVDRGLSDAGHILSDSDPFSRDHFLALISAAFEHNSLMLDAINDIKRVARSKSKERSKPDHIMVAEIQSLHEMKFSVSCAPKSHESPDMMIMKALQRFSMIGLIDDQNIVNADNNCWMLNLALAGVSSELGFSNSPLPYSQLVELSLFRRTDDQHALEIGAIKRSIEAVERQIRSLQLLNKSQMAFVRAFSGLRTNSKLLAVYLWLLVHDELSPVMVSRILTSGQTGRKDQSLSVPGARKLLIQLVSAGYARRLEGTSLYKGVKKVRLDLPVIPWLSAAAATLP